MAVIKLLESRHSNIIKYSSNITLTGTGAPKPEAYNVLKEPSSAATRVTRVCYKLEMIMGI